MHAHLLSLLEVRALPLRQTKDERLALPDEELVQGTVFPGSGKHQFCLFTLAHLQVALP